MIRTRCIQVGVSIAFLVLHAILADAQVLPLAYRAEPGTELTYSVIYTGRLFGYFRLPDIQTDQMQACTDILDKAASPEAAAFLEMLGKRVGLQVRVAVGDNFSPFVLAREMAFGGTFKSKDELSYDDDSKPPHWVETIKAPDPLARRLMAGSARLDFDNVACFLRRAGLDAIVPGKHDFYFGAERLLALSGLLASSSVDSRFRAVQMLGANLTINTKDSGRTPLPDRDVSADGYETDPLKDTNKATPILPKVALPWLRRIRIKNALHIDYLSGPNVSASTTPADILETAEFDPSELLKIALVGAGPQTIRDKKDHILTVSSKVGAVRICPVSRDNPAKVALDNLGNCRRLVIGALQKGESFSVDWPYAIEGVPGVLTSAEFALTVDSNQALCIWPRGDDKSAKPFCKPFSVHAPFFERHERGVTGGSQCTSASDGRVLPYVLKSGGDGLCVAIFGVVDPNLREYVGALNDTYVHKEGNRPSGEVDEDLTTEVTVIDPVEALTQVLQFCQADQACAGARKILLAHMPRGQAAQAAGRFPGVFDLVVAQTDSERPSGTLDVTKHVTFGTGEGVNDRSEPTVVVPGAHVLQSHPDSVTVRLQTATITVAKPSSDEEVRGLKNSVSTTKDAIEVTPLPPPAPDAVGESVLEWMQQSKRAAVLPPFSMPPLRPEQTNRLETLALDAMREYCNADVALLQHRDVYLSPALLNRPVTAAERRLAFDAIFWKGDFMSCRIVTGATLKALLDRSDEIQAAEANGVSGGLEFGRALAKTGVLKDGDDYLVGGQYLDPKRAYALATTDFLSEGDTGYSVLQSATPKPDSVAQLGHIVRLSEWIDDVVGGKNKPIKIASGDYLDVSTHAPFDTSALTGWHTVRDWFRDFIKPNGPAAGAGKLEADAQLRRIAIANLETADASFKVYRHDDTETAVNSAFGGNPDSSLINPNSQAFTGNVQLRLTDSWRSLDLYTLTEIHLDRDQKNKADDTGTTRGEKANQFAAEGGLLFNLAPRTRSVSSYKILAGYRFETQVKQPFLSLALADANKTTVYPPVPYSFLHTAKLGIRHEFKDSSFEVGGLIGSTDRVTEFDFTLDGVMTPCLVNSTQSVTDCAKAAKFQQEPTTDPKKKQQFQSGAFMNIRLNVPLGIGDLKLVSDEKGLFYRNNQTGDLTVDTRYRFDWKNSIDLPLFGNFKLAPAIERIWYENKAMTKFSSWGFNLDFKYNFEWHTGLEFKKALAFPAPKAE